MTARFRFSVTSGGHLIQLMLKARLNSKSDWVVCCCCSNEFWKFPITPVGTCFSVECSHGDFLYFAEQNFPIRHLCPLTLVLLLGISKKSLDLSCLQSSTRPSTFCILFQFTVVEMAIQEQSWACTIETEIPLYLCTQNKIFGCHINNNKGVLFLGKGDT